jgi:hypothetical protein
MALIKKPDLFDAQELAQLSKPQKKRLRLKRARNLKESKKID